MCFFIQNYTIPKTQTQTYIQKKKEQKKTIILLFSLSLRRPTNKCLSRGVPARHFRDTPRLTYRVVFSRSTHHSCQVLLNKKEQSKKKKKNRLPPSPLVPIIPWLFYFLFRAQTQINNTHLRAEDPSIFFSFLLHNLQFLPCRSMAQ